MVRTPAGASYPIVGKHGAESRVDDAGLVAVHHRMHITARVAHVACIAFESHITRRPLLVLRSADVRPETFLGLHLLAS